MNINIRGDKIEVTDSIKKYVGEKLDRLNKYFEDASKIDAHVLIRARNGEQIIEVTVPTSKYTLRAEEKHSDLYAAIDLVVDVLERQIRKNKTKLNKRRDSADVVFSFIPEEDEEYVVNNNILSVLEHSCEYFGSSYLGRKEGTKKLLGITHLTSLCVYPKPILT